MKIAVGTNPTGPHHRNCQRPPKLQDRGCITCNVVSQKASWDDIKKEHFVRLLLSYVHPNNQGRKGWSQETWVIIAEKMNTEFPESSISIEQLKQLERDLKKLYKSLKEILMQPGFEWDNGNCTLLASDNHWRELFLRVPKAKKWHRKILPYYASLDALYGSAQGGTNEKHGRNDPLGLSLRVNSTCVPNDANEEAEHSSTLSPPSNQDEQIYFPKWPDLFFEPTANFSPKRSRDSRLPESRINMKENQSCHEEAEPVIKKVAHNTTKCDFTIAQCLGAYHELSGFEPSDLLYVGDIFKNYQNREVFLSFRKDERAHWLSAMINCYKKAS